MAQQSLIYSFVARGNIVLAEHTSFSGNFSIIAIQCLQKLPSNNNKFTYICDNHTFNYLVDDGFVFLVVVDEAAGRQVAFLFLERVKEYFKRRYGGRAKTSMAHNLDKDYEPILRDHMQYCMDHKTNSHSLGNNLIYLNILNHTDTSIAIQCLQKLPSNSNKFTYTCDNHTFNYLVDDGFVFLVVADEAARRQVAFLFLERVKEYFKRHYGGRAETNMAHNLDKDYGPILRDHMQYCMDHKTNSHSLGNNLIYLNILNHTDTSAYTTNKKIR